MCGGALVVACTDCAEALDATATTSAPANAASFAFDISLLLRYPGIVSGGRRTRTVHVERRATRPDVNGRIGGKASPFGLPLFSLLPNRAAVLFRFLKCHTCM